MGRTESTFLALSREAGVELDPEPQLPWLTKRGHVDANVRAEVPDEVCDLLRRIHQGLGGEERALEAKRHGRDPKADCVLAEFGLLIEVDEIQHFTSDRIEALGHYPDSADVAYDLTAYREMARAYCARADGYRAAKPAPDFTFPGGRRAQRAYFDSVRDLLAPHFGLRVLRIPVPECDGTVAFMRFQEALGVLRASSAGSGAGE